MKGSLVAVVAALTLCVTALGMIVGTTGGGRDEADRATVVLHRHFVQTPTGLVEVGPRACDDPAASDAFSRFHKNVHVRVAGSPRQGEGMIARGCKFTR